MKYEKIVFSLIFIWEVWYTYKFFVVNTAWKVSKYGVISGPYLPVFGLNTEIYFVFSPNTGKTRTEITPYLDTFSRSEIFRRQHSSYFDPVQLIYDSVGIKAKGRISKRVLHKKNKTNFQKNKYLLPPDTHTHVCVSGGKKYSFFEKFGMLCFFVRPVLRFTLLPYCLR